ncbi:zinc-ribbon domain-containing protein [Amycolatopsis silviterrae]|uniref:zinc-ribbon domain-containing protein n=1 Tax=Amycolatopsis silviterrae TaxID=1656914 RepID=UPI003672E413
MATQECSEPGCTRNAAFATKTRPAWCDPHITEILRLGGLEPLEPFTKPAAWRLTRCLACGCEAHYRLEYTLDKNRYGEPTCRACFWRDWAEMVRQRSGSPFHCDEAQPGAARKLAEEHGFEYLEPLTAVVRADDPHRVRCRYCGRISAQRTGDISFGCSCQSNPRRDRQTTNVSGPKNKNLLKDSGLPVLDWWDHERNDPAAWASVTVRGNRDAHWRCPDCGLRFVRRVRDMVTHRQCPDCELKRHAAWEAENKRYERTPVAAVPELLAAWADEADPSSIMVGDGWYYRFRCPHGHHPRLRPQSYLQSGCPSCRGNETRQARLAQVEADPTAFGMNREIAAQWHPEKNRTTRLETVSPNSRKIVWWREPSCGHEWQESPADRQKGQRLRCPLCRTILDSLAYHYPEIAAEWSPANPLSAWQVRPSGQTAFVPSWICRNDTGHEWNATLTSRASGSSCPNCRETGKSKVELDHHAAAQAVFGNAASGQPIRHDAFTRRGRWLVDITADLGSGRTIAIEYDGSYWHADKTEIDTAKSLDLLAAGYLVARLREHPLPGLPIVHDDYTEIVVHSTAPDPLAVLQQVQVWTDTRTS